MSRHSPLSLSARVEANSVPEPNTGCWLWLLRLDRHGYGKIGTGHRTNMLAHRASWLATHGALPATLDHVCRVRSCVNPDHLRAISAVANVMIGVSPPSINARKTQCLRGHVYTRDTTRVSPNGHRACRVCIAAQRARRGAS